MFAGLARWIGFLTMAAGATAIILLAVGFGWFIFNIAGEEVTLDTRADGIVALTGAAARIPDAIELLATDRGKRLLITGVHRATNFNSLIVVTSNWHMPRAMAELAHQLPDVTLIAYPVISEKVKTEPWWSNLDTARFLFAEYLKYVLALARMHLDTDSAV